MLYAGYGILFGFANGVGYGFSLIASARAYPKRQGMAMGLVTACYAVGAIVFAQVLKLVHDPYGLTAALVVNAGVIAACGLLAAALLHRSGLSMDRTAHAASDRVAGDTRAIVLLWLGFGFGCTAGVVAISHAAGIVIEAGGTGRQAIIGVMLIGFGNAVGGLSIAGLADRLPLRLMLVGLPVLSTLGLVALALLGTPAPVIICLAVIGLAYGAIAAIYPVAAAKRFDIEHTPKIYGLVFTAWGVAGFVGPWLAGVIYDVEGGYRTALILAAVVSAGATARLRMLR